MEWLRGGSARRQFEDFVDGATTDLFRTGYLMTGDAAEAEDLVQETFIRVARHWGRVRSMDQPVAYARRILVNLALDGVERRSRYRDELDSEDALDDQRDDAATRALVGIENAAEFRWALAKLSRQQRAVLLLRYWEDLPEVEVARLLGCSVGTVKKATWRGVARLRQTLGASAPPASKGIASRTEDRRPSC